MENLDFSNDDSLNIGDKFPQDQIKSFTPRDMNRFLLANPYEPKGEKEKRPSESSPMRRKMNFPGTKRIFNKNMMKLKFLKPFQLKKEEKLLPMNAFLLSQKVKGVAKKMISIVRNNKFFSDIKNIKKYHHDIINDKGSTFNDNKLKLKEPSQKNEEANNKKRSKQKKIIGAIKLISLSFQKYFPVFNPNHLGKIIWDSIMVVLMMLCLYFYTLKIGFSLHLKEEPIYNDFKLAFTFALFLDIFISLNTIFYKEGIQISNRRKIFYHYLRTKFLADVLASTSSAINHFQTFNQTWEDLDPLIIYKLFSYHELEGRLKSALIINIKLEALYKIFILLLKIFIAAHIIACAWHYIGSINNGSETTEQYSWLTEKKIENDPWSTKYLYSVYWAITTMMTVGYGDITPNNEQEMIFNIFAMFFGCGLFGYSMNHIGDIIQTANQRESLLKKQLTQVRTILRRKNLPKELQTRVLKYLEFIWEQEVSEDPEQENLMMTKLSSNLRDELYLHTHVNYLRKVKVFRIFSDATLIRLASHMRKVRFSPEEFVYKSGEKEDYSLYFIIDGKMERISQKELGKTDSRIGWSILKNGDYFGLHELISEMPRVSGILASDFSSLFQLSREDFLKVIKRSPEEYEKFCLIKDDILLNSNNKTLEIKCHSCSMTSHKVENCRFFKYSPNILAVIGRYLLERKKFDKGFSRSHRETKNALSSKRINQISVEEFITAYKEDDDFLFFCELYSGENEMDKHQRTLSLENDDILTNSKIEEEDEYLLERLNHGAETDRKKDLIKLRSIKSPKKHPSEQHLDFASALHREQSISKHKEGRNMAPSDAGHLTQKQTGSDSKVENATPSELFIEMDRMRSYKHYFPNNNIESLVMIQAKRLKMRSGPKKKRKRGSIFH